MVDFMPTLCQCQCWIKPKYNELQTATKTEFRTHSIPSKKSKLRTCNIHAQLQGFLGKNCESSQFIITLHTYMHRYLGAFPNVQKQTYEYWVHNELPIGLQLIHLSKYKVIAYNFENHKVVMMKFYRLKTLANCC